MGTDALSGLYEAWRGEGDFVLVEGGLRLDTDALAKRIGAAANRLEQADVGPGSVVLFQGTQGAGAFVVFWAAMARGAVFAPVDATWPQFQLEQATGRFAREVTVGPADRLELLRAAAPEAEAIALEDFDHGVDGRIGFVEVSDGVAGAYLFTSGSTGVPKAVVLSRKALALSGRLVVDTFGWRAGEALINLPEYHTMSGLRNAAIAAPAAGMTWVAVQPTGRGGVFEVAEKIEETRCERLVCAPVLLRQFALAGGRIAPEGLRSLKAVYCTGANLNRADAEAFEARYGAPVIDYYGLTETGGLCLAQGEAVGCEARVEAGELQIKGPQLMSGYLGDPEATAARFDGAWLRTGDEARRLPDGRFELAGRRDHFVKTPAGDRVHPEEIEAVLEAHESVAEAAVLGLADQAGIERLSALVVARGEADPQALSDWVAGRLGQSRRPAYVRVVDALPRNAMGKLVRSELPALFE